MQTYSSKTVGERKHWFNIILNVVFITCLIILITAPETLFLFLTGNKPCIFPVPPYLHYAPAAAQVQKNRKQRIDHPVTIAFVFSPGYRRFINVRFAALILVTILFKHYLQSVKVVV